VKEDPQCCAKTSQAPKKFLVLVACLENLVSNTTQLSTQNVTMSSLGNERRHGVKGPLPKFQNSFTFKHNPNSRKTNRIAKIAATTNCCARCTAVIEWKRKFR
jgi:hypothetical protein